MADEIRHYTPFDYQREAAGFLLRTPRAALWAGMGLGKTSITLSVIDILKIAGSSYLPALVIAPKRVAQVVWTEEQRKWDAFREMTVQPIIGTQQERIAALNRRGCDIYTINYDNLLWLLKALEGRPWPFKMVIADESTRLKNFRLLGGGGARADALSMVTGQTGRWINLTGTPAPNGLQDLWGQFWFLDGGQRLGRSYTQFMNRWFREDKYTQRISVLPGAEKEIHDRIKDITLSLRTEDCLPDVLQPQTIQITVPLDKRSRSIYREMADTFFTKFESTEIEALSAAAKSSKLLQMASGAVYDGDHTAHEIHDAKIDALRELRDDLGEPLLVAYYFKFDIQRILKAFPDARVYEKERDRQDWNAGKIKMLLAHPASAGHGIDLSHGGRNIVFFTQTWDLELRQQIIERLGPARQRQAGYYRQVRIFELLAQGTIDWDVQDRTRTKISVTEALMRAARNYRGNP